MSITYTDGTTEPNIPLDNILALDCYELNILPALVRGWQNGFDLPRTMGQLALAGDYSLNSEDIRAIWYKWEMDLIYNH